MTVLFHIWKKRKIDDESLPSHKKIAYVAYKAGRTKSNPADFWAKGVIGFFDFNIIPLA